MRLVVAAVLLGTVACSADTRGDGPEPETSVATTGTSGVPAVPAGFELVSARVVEPDGSMCDLCLWLADNPARRSRGLMYVDDLGPADGMLFVYDAPRTTTFWMKDTTLPLSIVFYGADGGHLDSFDMDPCRTDPCPSYSTPRDFSVAVEVERGRLDELGLVAGSRFELLGERCDPDQP